MLSLIFKEEALTESWLAFAAVSRSDDPTLCHDRAATVVSEAQFFQLADGHDPWKLASVGIFPVDDSHIIIPTWKAQQEQRC